MGGGHHATTPLYDARKPFGGFQPPKVRTLPGRLLMGVAWCWIFLKFKEDGSHHYLRHHSWQDAHMIEYLEKVDKKYGSKYSVQNNIGNESFKGIYKVSTIETDRETEEKIQSYQI